MFNYYFDIWKKRKREKEKDILILSVKIAEIPKKSSKLLNFVQRIRNMRMFENKISKM